MALESIPIKSMTDEKIVFHSHKDLGSFYEKIVEQGQAVIVIWSEEKVERTNFHMERSELIKADFATKITDGKVKLMSECIRED